jgi:DNA polymerase III subunit delta
MKFSAAQTNAFLQKPDATMRVVLIYGPDSGLVCERAENLARKIVPDLTDPFRVAALTGSVIADDPARLMDEMAAQALGGGRRLIRLQHAADGLAGALATVLGDMPEGDSFLLIEAGELEKRSKLRALCENESKIACAIACYVEEGPARQRIISDILQAEKISVSRDVLMFLAEILPSDRMAMRSELEKLALYAKGKPALTIEDVSAAVQDAGAAEIDDLVYAVGSGDPRKVEMLIERLFAEQTSPVAILRAAQRHFLRLQWARDQMKQGTSANDAVKRLQPPVFWKYADQMSAQLNRWPASRIDRALNRLFEAEAAVKRTGTPDTVLVAQLLTGMAIQPSAH